jgi:hypothetical protein
VFPLAEQGLSSLCHYSGVIVFRHQSYSPDLPPVDLFLFPKVKISLKGRRFQNTEKSVTTTWDTISVSAISDCFVQLWETCVFQSREVLRTKTKQFSFHFMGIYLRRLNPGTLCGLVHIENLHDWRTKKLATFCCRSQTVLTYFVWWLWLHCWNNTLGVKLVSLQTVTCQCLWCEGTFFRSKMWDLLCS